MPVLDDAEKELALGAFVDHVIPGRNAQVLLRPFCNPPHFAMNLADVLASVFSVLSSIPMALNCIDLHSFCPKSPVLSIVRCLKDQITTEDSLPR